MEETVNEAGKQAGEDETEKKLDQLREAVNAQILRAHSSVPSLRKQALAKETFPIQSELGKDPSPTLSPQSSSPRSATSSQRMGASATIGPNIHPGDFPFPSMESPTGMSIEPSTIPRLPRAGSQVSDITVRFQPSLSETTPTISRRATYNSWSGPQDFPSPNIYDLTLKMNSDIGIDSFWENIIEIFVTNFYASRVSLSIPYDLTDISNTPWGLKATYNGSVSKQRTRIRLERRQSKEAPPTALTTESESDGNNTSSSGRLTPKAATSSQRRAKREGKRPVMASIDQQLDQMLDDSKRSKVYQTLGPLDLEDEPLIDNQGVQRLLSRGSIVVLSREYQDVYQMRKREEERLKTLQAELSLGDNTRGRTERKSDSLRSDVIAAWERTYFKPREPNLSGYEEYEQPFASPWAQSPAPSPAVLKETSESVFFDPQMVESAFSPSEESDYISSDAVYAIGMENYRSIIHVPLVHPQTAKSISSASEGESSGSSGHPRIVPIAIISFLSTVTPYPAHLITTLSAFAPLIATSLSQAIRHSNVVHQLALPPMSSPRASRSHYSASRTEGRQFKRSPPEDSPVTHSSATNSETSTPLLDLHGALFSPAVAEAETPSPYRSTLTTETDYFSHRILPSMRSSLLRPTSPQLQEEAKERPGPSDSRPSSSISSFSQETQPASSMTEPTTSSEKLLAPSPTKMRKRGRRSRLVHSFGATTQLPLRPRTTPRKGNSSSGGSGRPRRPTESFSEATDPFQMHTPSSRLLRVVVDSIPVHVFTASPRTGTITWANGRTLAYRGVTAEDYIATPWAALHPEDSEEFLKRWNLILRSEAEGISQSLRIRRFDGQYRWFASRVVPLRDARGGVVHWFGTAMDIHDQREAEITAARQEEIKASELKYRSLAEASPQIVFSATPSLGISYANSQWMTYSGVTYDDTAKLGFLSFVHPDDRTRCSLPTDTDESQFSAEVRLRSADHSYRWHLVKCIRIEKKEDSKDDVWLGTCTDIDDHKMLEQRLKQSNEAARAAEAEHKKRAEDALETRRQQEFFIDMVSHELRNPLSAIVQSSDVVLNSLRSMLSREISSSASHEISDDIETMKSIALCTMHMRRLIDDTINVSKLESGMLQVTPVDCNPMTIVKQIQQIFDAELQSKKIDMTIVQDPSYNELGVEWVRADPSRISQILINLLSNSIKFLDNRPERHIVLTVSASTTAPKPDATALHSPERQSDVTSEDLFLTFSIKDTGPGLKPGEMAALFQRFSQATPRTHVTYGGSGLGLFISKRLVELQGGRIYVDSVAGKGSTFTFYIEVERSTTVAKQSSPPTPVKAKEEEIPEEGDKQTHVLVVEDNLINQRLLKKQLIGSGYRVSVANHGQEAIDKILACQDSDKDAIDIVLMDVEMPILNGLEATKLLRQAEVKGALKKHIPVIAVSANAREEQKKRMFDAGADGYLTKPFQLPELVAKLREQTEPKV